MQRANVTTLARDTNGDFYGTPYYAGANADGTAFKITPGGTLTTLYSFYRAPGAHPVGGPVQATDGKLSTGQRTMAE